LATGVVLAGIASVVVAGADTATAPASAPSTSSAPLSIPERTLHPEPYAGAAELLRGGDYAGAATAVRAVGAAGPAAADQSRLVLGLYAFAVGDLDRTFESFAAAPAADLRFEDWRLLLLATAAETRGRVDTASAALGRLLADLPASPLRPRALLAAARLARVSGPDRALTLVEQARQEGVAGSARVDLEALAWSVGGADPANPVAREAARQLLTRDPVAAERLGVAARFGRAGTQPGWRVLLSNSELQTRAEAFIAGERFADALATLQLVSGAERGLDWTLLQARVLSALHRGGEALTLLEAAASTSATEQAQVAWARATAAADLAVAIRGRANLPAAGRAEMQRLANTRLKEVAELDADPALTTRALRLLFENLADDNLFDAAVTALRRLRALDPRDTTGASYLWELGWDEYRKANYSGAVGNWTVLEELYPQTTEAHRGAYWKARAFEGLGDRARAETMLRAIVAGSDTGDFYRRQAVARLGSPLAGVQLAGNAPFASEPWQIDPLLERARTLVDLGLDALAADELELLGERGNARDRVTLRALLLAEKGERVDSIKLLRQAWPALGTAAQSTVPLVVRRAYYPFEFGDILARNAERTGLPVHLLAGIIRQESAFNPKAKSRAGARGLMQVMPTTAREVAKKLGIPFSTVRLFDPDLSVTLGSTYFKSVLDGFDGNLELALAGYNGGPGRIRRMWQAWGGNDLDLFLESLSIEESKTYVKRVLVLSDSYRQLLEHGRDPTSPAG
jgi:soluble lytic murein transglycosylase